MSPPTLIQRTGRAAFWNAVMIPLQAGIGVAFASVVARHLELYVGVYDVAMGVVASVVMFTGLGIPNSLTKFLPELEGSAGPPAVAMFLRRAAVVRLALAAAVLVPMAVFAAPLAAFLNMGDQGPLILRLATVLIAARALAQLCTRGLTALFGQLEANTLQLMQGILEFLLVGGAVLAGYQVAGIFGMVVASGIATAVAGLFLVRRVLRSLDDDQHGGAFVPVDPGATRVAVGAETRRFAGFAAFTFLFDIAIYLSDKAFAASALGVAVGTDDVAIFNRGYVLAFMSVGLMVSSFRGVYRPMFAHLRSRRDPDQLRRAFVGISKVQLVVLVPAGTGLFVLAGDYVPLLFGSTFVPSVPITQMFVVLLYTATAFNLGVIWLSIDERYSLVLAIQSIMLVGASAFVWVAGTFGLLPAAFVLGGSRLLVNFTGYLFCRGRYGFGFPWLFAARIAVVAGVMAAAIIGLHGMLPRSPATTIGLTLLGAAIYLVGLRAARILGPEEIDLLERSSVPGVHHALAWLAPGRARRGDPTDGTG